jgi:hypothetical protein
LLATHTIMAGVLRRLFWPQKVLVQDQKIMELQAAKEIQAEVFMVRVQDVDAIIQNRFEAASSGDVVAKEDGLWLQEFRL